eukprot:TRINITY_DN6827_c0_g1_i1.p1 TRINITY_DN6827_c0_g1~~TRINITY_DN6827_c0_g1_i1.p1  ORF type:complete len:387 (-),score=144.65 TRINITY_DN6827_c0_g1_i1:540-1700(-)
MMGNLSVKLFAFFALAGIQVLIAFVYKASQKSGKYTFSPSSAIAMAEFFKFWISFVLHTRASFKPGFTVTEAVRDGIVTARTEMSKNLMMHLFGLATLYCVNNQFSFVLFRLADPATINLFKSSSTFFAAMLLFVFAHRPINRLQWPAIMIQVFGLAIVQYDPCKDGSILPAYVYAVLISAVLITSVSSVWNEHMVKNHRASLHVQNMGLYAFGFTLNLLGFLMMPILLPAEPSAHIPFFEGYTLTAIGVVFCNSIVGVVITAVYKYADAIVKTFASACSTCVFLFVSPIFFGWSPTLVVYLGCFVVFAASYSYFTAASLNPPPAAPAAAPETDEENGDRPKSPAPPARSWTMAQLAFMAVGAVLVVFLIVVLFTGGSTEGAEVGV